MNDATRRVTQWIIGVREEVSLVEELATAEDVQSFVCGHVRWVDGTPGPAVELEDIDFTTVDWRFVLRAMHAALQLCISIAVRNCRLPRRTDEPGVHPTTPWQGEQERMTV